MREVSLNGKRYEIVGEITKLPVNPWTAQIAGAGLEYSTFQKANIEEWHDFRSGIGRESALPEDTSRLWWLNGVDVATPRSAVLNPLVNTAEYDDWEASHNYALLNFVIPTTPNGYCYECTTDAGSSAASPEPTWPTTVGLTVVDDGITWTCRAYLATVKIIDFQDSTYAIQDNRILKWDGTNLDCVDNSLDSPIDAIVITDDTDEYLIVSSATEAYYTTDGATWAKLTAFGSAIDLTDFTEVDANSKLTVISTKATAVNADTDEDVYLYNDYGTSSFNDLDIDFEIYVNDSSSVNSTRCGIAVANTVGNRGDFATTDISATGRETGGGATIELVRGNAVASDSYAGSLDTPYYCTLIRTAGSDTVTLKIYSDSGRTTLVDTLLVEGYSTTTYRYFYAFVNNNDGSGNDFDGYIQNINLNKTAGYMADYANRLYFISTDGKYIYYSAAKNIDAGGGSFTLTGNFGTLYDFFEGKLLSDGSPTLYFCGTQGLYSLDTSTEIAYKQEVEYPPLTYSGHVGKYWNANLWVATGYGILKVSSSIATLIGPDQDDGLPSGYQGYIYDFDTVNNWLVYCVNGGTTDKSSILKRNASVGGNIQVYTTSATSKAIVCILHSPSSLGYTNGRLWWGEGTDIKYCMFPDTTSNVKQVSTYQYATASDSQGIILPKFRKLAAIKKVALNVSAVTKSCDADEYITLYYEINETGSWTELGTYKTSPKPTMLEFASGLGTEFYVIKFAAKLQRGNTNTNSPELESLAFAWRGKPVRISSWTFSMRCTSKEFSELETIYDTATLVTFYPSGDVAKPSHNVAISMMPERYAHEEMGGSEGVVQITIEEVYKG